VSASPRGPVGVHVERGNQQRRIKVVGADGEVKGEVPHYAVVQALIEREGIATSLTPDALVEEELRAITVCEVCREKPLGMRARSLDQRRHKPRPWTCHSCAKLTPEQAERWAKLNLELRSITICEGCHEKPLSQKKPTLIARRGRARPWLCRSCSLVTLHAAKTPEQRLSAISKAVKSRTKEQMAESAKRMRDSVTAEQRREFGMRLSASLTPEQRKEIRRKQLESMTPERRHEIAMKAVAARTPEQRSEASRRSAASLTPEQRSERARKASERGRAAMTPEQLSDAMRKVNAARTPEQCREGLRKALASLTPEQRRERVRKAWATRRARQAATNESTTGADQ
jgi:hypothetical protein